MTVKVTFSFYFKSIILFSFPNAIVGWGKNRLISLFPRTIRRISPCHSNIFLNSNCVWRFNSLVTKIILTIPLHNFRSENRSVIVCSFFTSFNSHTFFFPGNTILTCGIPYIASVPWKNLFIFNIPGKSLSFTITF